MTRSQVANLALNVNNSVHVKTISTFDKNVIDRCHYYMGYNYAISVTVRLETI